MEKKKKKEKNIGRGIRRGLKKIVLSLCVCVWVWGRRVGCGCGRNQSIFINFVLKICSFTGQCPPSLDHFHVSPHQTLCHRHRQRQHQHRRQLPSLFSFFFTHFHHPFLYLFPSYEENQIPTT